MRLSVVIVNYGLPDDVAPCLESLAADRTHGLFEVILVDNATPGFDDRSFRSRFPWVRLVSSRQNRGFASGCNLGIDRSSTEYVLLLNPDTRVPAGTLSSMLEYLDASSDVGAATCRVNLADGNLDPACHRGFPTPWASLTYLLRLERLFPRSRLLGQYHMTWLPLDQIHEIDSPSGCFFLVRRKAIEQVGHLDEEYFMYGEDLDWAKRIKSAGWKIVFNPGVCIVHLKGMVSGIKESSSDRSTSSLADRQRAYHAFYDAMRIFYRKHYQSRNPFFVTWLVMLATSFRERLGARRLRV